MHKNHTYNLLQQLVQEQKSLWRIKEMYPKDTEGCEECNVFWHKMAEDKESHIEEITALLTSHLNK